MRAPRGGNCGILSIEYYIALNEPVSEHNAVDPMEGAPTNLTPEQRKLILGGQATMWSWPVPENSTGESWSALVM